MSWAQFYTIGLTAVFSALFSAIFANVATYLKEKKLRNENASVKYKEETLSKIYTPIYRIVTKELYTAKGYDGLNHEQITQVKGFVDNFPEYCTAELIHLVNHLFDDSARLDDMAKMGYSEPSKVDGDSRLYNYVTNKFNSIRKELGMITK
ncbi:hypothetical protein P9F82_07865 [Bacillus subtilis]|uniref:hypothetical protein n=1 Tax=Bacillus subtilis TaxID=1423 RepID=UPI002DB6C80F|nr:hypothetical protein [Bacillus subtilis]MEC2202356.1 hypothetical protein [Bacillus subtilis]